MCRDHAAAGEVQVIGAVHLHTAHRHRRHGTHVHDVSANLLPPPLASPSERLPGKTCERQRRGHDYLPRLPGLPPGPQTRTSMTHLRNAAQACYQLDKVIDQAPVGVREAVGPVDIDGTVRVDEALHQCEALREGTAEIYPRDMLALRQTQRAPCVADSPDAEVPRINVDADVVAEGAKLFDKPSPIMGITRHSPRSGGVAVTQEVTEGIGLE